METKFPTFKGKCKWCRVFQPNKWRKWSLDLYLDNEQVEKFKALETMNHVKKDDDGYFVTLSRPVEKESRFGKKVGFNPPVVVDKDGNNFPPTPIGNGSDLTCTLEHYSYKDPSSGKTKYAIRLYAVRVDNLIEMSKNDYTPEEMQARNNIERRVPNILGPKEPNW